MAPSVRRRATIGTVSTEAPPNRRKAASTSGSPMISCTCSGERSSSRTDRDPAMLRRLGDRGGEVPGVQRDASPQVLLAPVPVPGRRPVDLAVLVDERQEHPVGEAGHAQRGQPVQQLAHVEGGDECAGRLRHEREAPLGRLGVGPGRARRRDRACSAMERASSASCRADCSAAKAASRSRFHPDPLGDVGLHAHEAHQRALAVEDRADRQLVPERGAVLAVVQQRRGDACAARRRRRGSRPRRRDRSPAPAGSGSCGPRPRRAS